MPILKLDKNLIEVLIGYYIFLVEHSTYDNNNYIYLYEILKTLDISEQYVKSIIFDDCLDSGGIYLPNEKIIVINLKELTAIKYLNFITIDEYILEYFKLLFHEINHVLQTIYRINYNDDIKKILDSSIYLKTISKQNNIYFHKYYPDEIDSMLKSSILIRDFSKFYLSKELSYCEKNLIRCLKAPLYYENKIINSQYIFLYKKLCNIDTNEPYNLSEIENIYYGLTKSKQTLNNILRSNQTHKLCLKI